MISVAFAIVSTFVSLFGVFALLKVVTDDETALITTVVLSFAVGVLMIDYIWPWGIFLTVTAVTSRYSL